MQTGLFLEGLRCAGCARRVEGALRELPGVERASVSLAAERALVAHDPGRVDAAALVRCLTALGYAATPYDPDAVERPGREARRHGLVRLLVAGFVAANTMSLSLALYFGSYAGIDPGLRAALRGLVLALSLPSVTWCALPFWRGAWADLRGGRLGMDIPVVLAVSIAFAATCLGTWSGAPHVFADSAPTMVFLILLGRTLERGARGRAASDVERLLCALPPHAVRRRGAATEHVAPRELVAGDVVVVPAGSAFPADGRVLRGATEVDESLLSGESRPQLRAAGDPVSGGTRNLLHEVEVQVSAAVGHGVLARMGLLLERAAFSKPAIQRAADRVAAVFAPAVLAAAAVTGLAWRSTGASWTDATLAAAAVMAAACPCALSLATPVALAAALGRAARMGILFKSGEALERCAAAEVALLDKTGTLTQGRLEVRAVLLAPGVSEEEALQAAAAAEGSSPHPIAEALRRELERRGLRAPELEPRSTLAGHGVVAGEGTLRIAVGTRALLGAQGVLLPEELAKAAEEAGEGGDMLAFVARGSAALGVLVLRDALRPDAAEAVRRLLRLGVRCALVSGDRRESVSRAAVAAGIRDVTSEATPAAKLARVECERRGGARVLVAGDGHNDAAALAAADVGVAFARGADVPLHAADVVVRAPRLGAVPDAVALAREAMRRVRQGFALALLYNVVAVPLAALGILQPLGAALAMGCSSLLVTANALRIARWKPGE
jgi:heavy metal translocating P-type ATPase